jgi:hypothetical protein
MYLHHLSVHIAFIVSVLEDARYTDHTYHQLNAGYEGHRDHQNEQDQYYDEPCQRYSRWVKQCNCYRVNGAIN